MLRDLRAGVKMTLYCCNDPCETEATHYYITESSQEFYLCRTCMEAFELGQVNRMATIFKLDEEAEDHAQD